MYIVYDNEGDTTELEIFGDDLSDAELDQSVHTEPEVTSDFRDKNDNVYKHGYTLPRLIHCVECSQLFRTYVPNTDCLLPDGNLVYCKESQTICPECSGGSFLSINEDLFPHLAQLKKD
ncbi:PREDICTED: uncharacterized protein LOC109589478 [Amphimedon queenslandica]|uniref:Uncharacterized protein n=1 Tax=Amphimedon queenslandica TaxID=400682 RepID=A0AAN0JW34_AMPQE|nr:PREDICTED: uncharacterized protein LOC109589478 [Amphimedon queenslandica]|eukprot:XP_019861115.1 PREDICTED: uncharacterized protein LOC109589478 [Amphimedon queenslandica]